MDAEQYIYAALIGKLCTYGGEQHTIKRAYFEGSAYGGVRMSVKICNGVDTEVVPMSSVVMIDE